MKDFFKRTCCWAKRHTFHFGVVIALTIGGSIVISQQATLFVLKGELKQSKIDSSNALEKTKKDAARKVAQVALRLEKKIHHTSESFNARVDTLANTVIIKDTRRELIVNIRNAIINNTTHTIGVRDLNRMANAIIDYSYQFNLTIPQVLAQIKVESDFKVRAVSSAGAQGLMQIMPQTLKYIGYDMPSAPARLNPWNVHHNIKAGCFYMSEQIEEFGTHTEALKAYNWGPDNLKKYNVGERKSMPQETIDYIPRNYKYIEIFSRYGLE